MKSQIAEIFHGRHQRLLSLGNCRIVIIGQIMRTNTGTAIAKNHSLSNHVGIHYIDKLSECVQGGP